MDCCSLAWNLTVPDAAAGRDTGQVKTLAIFVIYFVCYFAGLSILSKGIYPPFRGTGSLWLEVLGATPTFIRLMAGSTLTILILCLHARIMAKVAERQTIPMTALLPPLAASLMLLCYVLLLQMQVLSPESPLPATVSVVIWALVFTLTIRCAQTLIPSGKSFLYYKIATFVGAAIAISPLLEGAPATFIAPVMIPATLGLVASGLHALGSGHISIRYDEIGQATINVDGFEVAIANSCSGYEGALIALVLVGGYVWFNRARLILPRALIMFPLIAVAMFALNSARILVLILIGAHVSPAIAVQGFHVYAGWIYLITIVLGAVLWLETSRWVSRVLPTLPDHARAPQTGGDDGLIIPLVVFLALSIVLGAISDGLNWLYPVNVVICGLVASRYFGRLWKGPSGFEGQAIAMGCLVAALWFALVVPDPVEADKIAAELTSAPIWAVAVWMMFRFIGSVIVVPIVEEMGFRGALQPRLGTLLAKVLGERSATVLSIGLAALLFGVLHSSILAATIAGALYGWLRHASGSLMAPIIAHAVTNFIISMYVLTSGSWSYW